MIVINDDGDTYDQVSAIPGQPPNVTLVAQRRIPNDIARPQQRHHARLLQLVLTFQNGLIAQPLSLRRRHENSKQRRPPQPEQGAPESGTDEERRRILPRRIVMSMRIDGERGRGCTSGLSRECTAGWD